MKETVIKIIPIQSSIEFPAHSTLISRLFRPLFTLRRTNHNLKPIIIKRFPRGFDGVLYSLAGRIFSPYRSCVSMNRLLAFSHDTRHSSLKVCMKIIIANMQRLIVSKFIFILCKYCIFSEYNKFVQYYIQL